MEERNMEQGQMLVGNWTQYYLMCWWKFC